MNVRPLSTAAESTPIVIGRASASTSKSPFLGLILESTASINQENQSGTPSQTTQAGSNHSKVDPLEILAGFLLTPGSHTPSVSILQSGQSGRSPENPKDALRSWKLDPFGLPIQIVLPSSPIALTPRLGPVQPNLLSAPESFNGKNAAAGAREAATNSEELTGTRAGAELSDVSALNGLAFMLELHGLDGRSAASDTAPGQSTEHRGNAATSAARTGGMVVPNGSAPVQNNSAPQATETAPSDGGSAPDSAAKRTESGPGGETGGQDRQPQTLETVNVVHVDKPTSTEISEVKPQSVNLEQTNLLASNANAGQSAIANNPKLRQDPAPSSAQAASPDDAVRQQPETGAAARQLALHLDHETLPGVSLQLVERDGAIRVSVRTPDTELNGRMQANLNDLVNSLKQEGFEADAWTPAQAAANGQANHGSPDSHNTGGQSGHSHQPERRNGYRRERRQRNAPASDVSFASQFPI